VEKLFSLRYEFQDNGEHHDESCHMTIQNLNLDWVSSKMEQVKSNDISLFRHAKIRNNNVYISMVGRTETGYEVEVNHDEDDQGNEYEEREENSYLQLCIERKDAFVMALDEEADSEYARKETLATYLNLFEHTFFSGLKIEFTKK
jgi:hypothetical protein